MRASIGPPSLKRNSAKTLYAIRPSSRGGSNSWCRNCLKWALGTFLFLLTFSIIAIISLDISIESVISWGSIKFKPEVKYVQLLRKSRRDHTLSINSELPHNFDEGNSSGNVIAGAPFRGRLLFMTASYNMEQIIALQRVLDTMIDHCNNGWDVTVHLQVTSNSLTESSDRLLELKDRLFCLRSQRHIPLIVEEYDDNIAFGLNSRHRLFLKERAHDFDYFVYAEEDMLFTVSHFNSYLHYMSLLRRRFPSTWLRYYVGFLRFEESSDGERVSWEYLRHQIYGIDLRGGSEPIGSFIATLNLNQAIYVLSQAQVLDMEERCGFLSEIGASHFYKALRQAMNKEWKYMAVGVSEWSSSFQLILQCGLRRIIPSDHIQSFMIHHGTNKGHHRRTKKDYLNAREWVEIAKEKSLAPLSLDLVYNDIIFHQYNLHLLDTTKLVGKSKWSYEFAFLNESAL